jgi:hypothetical protein
MSPGIEAPSAAAVTVIHSTELAAINAKALSPAADAADDIHEQIIFDASAAIRKTRGEAVVEGHNGKRPAD